MKRLILLLLLLLAVPNAFAAYTWSAVDNGPFETVRVVEQANGHRMIFAIDVNGDVIGFEEDVWGLPWFRQFHGRPMGGALLGEPLIPVLEANGLLTVFALGDDDRIYFMRQLPGGGFTFWQDLPMIVDTYEIAKNAAGHLELYTVERFPQSALMRYRQSFVGADTYIDPVPLAARNEVKPILGAAAHADQKLEVFIVFADGHVRGRKQVVENGGVYGDWVHHGAPTIPDVHDLELTMQSGRLALFTLYGGWWSMAYRQQVATGAFDAPVQLWGHSLRTGFRATTSIDDRLHVFVIGGDTKIYWTEQAWSGGPWHNWGDAGILAKRIDVSPRNSAIGNVDLFAVDTRGRIMHGQE